MLSVSLFLCNSRLQKSADVVICIFETVVDALSVFLVPLVLQRLQHVVQQCSLFGTSDQTEFVQSPVESSMVSVLSFPKSGQDLVIDFCVFSLWRVTHMHGSRT